MPENGGLLDDSARIAGCILLVEDDEPIRHLLRAALADEPGIELVEAESAALALELLERSNEMPSLVIVDAGLPDLDGEVFMRHVRQRFGPGLPLMVFSALAAEEVQEIARRVEAQSAIVKPFEVLDFLREVRRILRYPSSAQLLR